VPAAPGVSLTRIFVAGDVGLYAECLALSLVDDGEISVAGIAPCASAAEAVADAEPDVLLVDVSSSQALALVAEIVSLPDAPRVIALAAPDTEEGILACIEAGVSAFVPADGTLDDLRAALRHVVHGEPVVSPRIATALIRRVRQLADTHAGGDANASLTARELEIVGLIARGLSNKEIARALSIEVSTVKNHVHSILGKLAVTRRTDVPAKLWPARSSARSWVAD
jgi:two-component system, NarL family, nitrate/nitrite response regulator NarL